MIRPLALILVMLCLARAATAEPVLVRTAEHRGFTRVVVDFTDRPRWALGRVGDTYELRTDAPEIAFDLSDIYRRIYAGRLLSIQAVGPGALRLTTGCACALSTALRANGGLIIDISDTAPAAGNPHERDLPPGTAGATAPAPRPGAPRVTLPLLQEPAPPAVLPVLADLSVHEAAAELDARLTAEIGRAAELDLIELAAGVSADSLAARNTPRPDRAPGETASPATVDGTPPMASGPNLRIVTEAERALAERGSVMSVDPSLCSRFETSLDPNRWVSAGMGPAGTAIDRRSLIDIRGQADARGFGDVIRGYLYLTFGREAAAAIRAAPDNLADAPLLAALANLVEKRPAGNSALAGLTSCPGYTGLWARLADPGAVAHRGDPSRAEAFASWPAHLRITLGPPLVEAYLDAGDEDTARGIFRALARVAAPDDPAFALAAARLSEPPRPSAPRDPVLEEIAQTRRPESVRALLGVIDARIAENVPVGADLAMQAGALAFELGDTDDAQALRAAEIRALLHDRSWRAAVARLESGESVPDRAALLTELATEAVANANDTDLLWLAARIQHEAGVGRRARAGMAGRIARLGMADLARTALDLGTAIPTTDERRILAEIALVEGRPAIAEAYLAGLDSDADLALTARASAMRAGQAAAAAAGFTAEPTPDAPPDDSDATAPAEPADVARSPRPAPPPPSEGGLAASRNLLGNSADLRIELEALLKAPGAR